MSIGENRCDTKRCIETKTKTEQTHSKKSSSETLFPSVHSLPLSAVTFQPQHTTLNSRHINAVPVPSSSSLMTNHNNNNNNNGIGAINNNKKHNLGYRLRRLFFGPSTTSGVPVLSSSAKSKTVSKVDVEAKENKNFLKHNPSIHSSASESSDDRKLNSKKKQKAARFQSQLHTTYLYPHSTSDYKYDSNAKSFSSNSSDLFECPICFLKQSISRFPELSLQCYHRACIECLREYLRVEIYDSRVTIACSQCPELLHPNDIKTILKSDNALIEKYETFMVRRALITDPDSRWCPAPDCDYCVIATGCASCPMLKCERPGCSTLFCYHCKQEWHSNQTCDQARAQRGFNKSVFISSPSNQTKSNVTFTSRITEAFPLTGTSTSVDLSSDEIKPCPFCKVLIIKMDDGSCNHMTCSVCGTEFCWLCMQKISDLHYLSPSGCTFWGKKPWSRKKKIMWQLGMLVGAPVGIALIAGIAVPAIIIGIPVWVGRKLHARFERNHLSRPKSNFLVTTGVLTSICVSPLFAAVAVGIGVPILLAYVYGVVPISLCRSGGCGVSTSSSGVRLELDEDDISANLHADGASVDTALSVKGMGNPSIGEVSLGMSTSLSNGSSNHLDRIVLDIQPDRESSSIAACAGSISSHNANFGGHRNVEHQAELYSNNKRFSFSSQNADASSVTLSFGERSIHNSTSLVDDASLKVHAGSLKESFSHNSSISHNQKPNYSVSPVEVHINIEETFNPSYVLDQSSLDQQSKKTSNSDDSSGNGSSVNFILKKFESRSLEYLSNNYCNHCHKSHKPCCPNYQHSNSKYSVNIKKFKLVEQEKNSDTSLDAQHCNEERDSSNKHMSSDENVKVCDKEDALMHLNSCYHIKTNSDSTQTIIDAPSALKKKSLSQIVYSQHLEKDLYSKKETNENKGSCLSHSLSFTAASNQN